MTPTPEDMVRDLQADLAEYDDIQREAGIGLAFGISTDANGYASDVYEFAGIARDGWPAAIRRALAAEAELARVKQECRDLRGALEYSINRKPLDLVVIGPGLRQEGTP